MVDHPFKPRKSNPALCVRCGLCEAAHPGRLTLVKTERVLKDTPEEMRASQAVQPASA